MRKKPHSLAPMAVLLFMCVFGWLMFHPRLAAAACTALPTNRGTVTSTLVAPVTGTYRVWSRIKTTDASKNSFYLQIDNTTCNIDVAASGITANTWTWVDYQGGVTSNKLNVDLVFGTHTMIMAGKDDNVELDRIILTQDSSCIPLGTGDNCAYPPDTTPPTVSITAPTNGAVVTTTTSIDAAASDDVAVTKLEFYVDGVLRATDSAPPFSYALDPTTLSIGGHTVAAKAYDAAGNATSSAVITITIPDTVKPTVSVTSPAPLATVSGTIAVLASASDNIAVSKVEFYLDGALKATDTSSSYSASIDTKLVADGNHTLTAKAYDAANNSQTSVAITVNIDNVPNQTADTTPPSVTLTAPSAGSTISGTIIMTATASDASGVKKVDFYNGTTLLGSDSIAPYSYIYNTSQAANGAVNLKAIATDNAPVANVASSSTINATIANVVYLAEDIDQSGTVALRDFSLLAADYGHSGQAISVLRADIDKSGTVDLHDFALLASKYGQ